MSDMRMAALGVAVTLGAAPVGLVAAGLGFVLWLGIATGALGVVLAAEWTPLAALVGAVVTAAITGLVTYLVATRQRSGTVETSEATDLWSRSDRIMDRQEARIMDLEKLTRDQSDKLWAQDRQIWDLTHKLEQRDRTIAELQAARQ